MKTPLEDLAWWVKYWEHRDPDALCGYCGWVCERFKDEVLEGLSRAAKRVLTGDWVREVEGILKEPGGTITVRGEVSPRKAARKDSIEGDGGSPGVAEGNFSCAEKEAKTAKEVNLLILDRKEESARVEAEVAAQLANAEWITPKEGE